MSIALDYQAPLTHRTTGPGLVLLFSDRYQAHESHSGPFHLDPPPKQKWAEEGFCVLSMTVSPAHKDQMDLHKMIEIGLKELRGKDAVTGDRFGLIVYEGGLARDLLGSEALGRICCVIAYIDELDASRARSWQYPLLRHVSTRGSSISQPLIQNADSALQDEAKTPAVTYEYTMANRDPNSNPSSWSCFVLPGSPEYNHTYATLAHTRTLTFLREHIGGPVFNIESIWEEHTRLEFEGRDVEGTMGTMVAEPYVNHIPTLTGGIGRTALTSFYRNHFIHSNPSSTRLELVSRTIGPDRVVDEFIFEFVHDMEIDWMLPGVPPTGKHVRVPFVAVVNMRGDKLYHEHIYWDQASVLVQIGLLPESLAFPGTSKSIRLPVAGIEQAEKMLNPSERESNLLINGRAEEGKGVGQI